MPKLRFPCKIKNGKITLLNRAEFDNAISNLEGNYYIELKETGVRSAQQNNYYWNIVRVIADELGYTEQEMHTTIKITLKFKVQRPYQQKNLAIL